MKMRRRCSGPRDDAPRKLSDTVPGTFYAKRTGGLIARVLGLILLILAHSEAQQPVANQDPPTTVPAVELRVAATVNSESIYVAEVEQRVRQSLGGRDATPQARVLLQAEALRQLIEQQMVLASLEERGEAASVQEVDVEVRRLQDDLARQEKTLDDYCRSQEIQESILRQQLRWQLSWKRCLSQYLTDENLQRYFDRHRREFDGTTMRVAQVLLKSETETKQGAAQAEQLLTRARQIRQEILSGKITFADAARKYSQSPSSGRGGQLDWISCDGPMPDFFTRAAFTLEVGAVSEPIVSPYGVHLIQCLEIKPGEKSWLEVREKLTNAVSQYVFRWLVERPRPQQDVQYTETVPHFQPGTRQLVLPPDQKTEQTTSEGEQAGK